MHRRSKFDDFFEAADSPPAGTLQRCVMIIGSVAAASRAALVLKPASGQTFGTPMWGFPLQWSEEDNGFIVRYPSPLDDTSTTPIFF